MKLVRKVQVRNIQGLHTRPATLIVRVLQTARSGVTLTHRNETVDARSILNILMLAVQKNAYVTISVEGEDAEETMQSLLEIFENGFGEELHKGEGG